jgi:aromatic-L-amino-acid decarboxylase
VALRVAIGRATTTRAHVERAWALLCEGHDWLAADFAEQAAERARAEAERKEAERRAAEEEAARRHAAEQAAAEQAAGAAGHGGGPRGGPADDEPVAATPPVTG